MGLGLGSTPGTWGRGRGEGRSKPGDQEEEEKNGKCRTGVRRKAVGRPVLGSNYSPAVKNKDGQYPGCQDRRVSWDAGVAVLKLDSLKQSQGGHPILAA